MQYNADFVKQTIGETKTCHSEPRGAFESDLHARDVKSRDIRGGFRAVARCHVI